ncbi:class F sortase [Kitasatospora kifunensis]|uniref:Sortase (Surface protein transpeptidase) n=1 Tax=Kitasatospora kifunensis TaxID=58351 RepID=A0A7W7QYH6_KITKI|nr:class F sortase [Kitasatospora kifunensis]MBB4922128.1 sortase (surface protein transpeptidase) [Kitasatospora kifunensis]
MGNHADANGDSLGTGTLSHQRRSVLFAALGACLLGLFMIRHSGSPPPPAPQARAVAIASPNAAASPSTAPSPSATRRPPAIVVPDAHPIRLSIPAIGVNAPFTGLSLDPTGVLNVPPASDTNLVGWYQAGTVPGNKGTAIVLGHVDTKAAPAVFWSLSTLTKGATVDIARDDKVTATFTVDSVEVFPKDQFPDDRVYGKAPDAQLRLITCGGAYDHARADYTANVVVFAHLSGLRES